MITVLKIFGLFILGSTIVLFLLAFILAGLGMAASIAGTLPLNSTTQFTLGLLALTIIWAAFRVMR